MRGPIGLEAWIHWVVGGEDADSVAPYWTNVGEDGRAIAIIWGIMSFEIGQDDFLP